MSESLSDLRKKASTLKKRIKVMEDASGIGVAEKAGADGDRFAYKDKSLFKKAVGKTMNALLDARENKLMKNPTYQKLTNDLIKVQQLIFEKSKDGG
tara:strand:+ start:287 stop:577 length:291 start_codon:yes stop_codon:yes gene_type:complete